MSAGVLTHPWQNDNRFGLLMGNRLNLHIYGLSVPTPPHTVQPQAALVLLFLNSFKLRQFIILARFLSAFVNNEKKQKRQNTHFASDCLVAWQRFLWKFDYSSHA